MEEANLEVMRIVGEVIQHCGRGLGIPPDGQPSGIDVLGSK